jgi:hypothetical protein
VSVRAPFCVATSSIHHVAVSLRLPASNDMEYRYLGINTPSVKFYDKNKDVKVEIEKRENGFMKDKETMGWT